MKTVCLDVNKIKLRISKNASDDSTDATNQRNKCKSDGKVVKLIRKVKDNF